MSKIGRALIPLIFKDGEKEVRVKDIESLRDYWRKEHLDKLIEYLHDGRLEGFFHALRMDEVKKEIKRLMDDGRPDLDILNEVGKILGFSPIEGEELYEEKAILKEGTLLDEVFSLKDKTTVKLLPGEWKTERLEAVIDQSFRIEGSGNKKTVIQLGELFIDGKERLEIEELCFRNESREGVIRVRGGEVIFREVFFSGVRIVIDGGKVVTEDCHFENLNTAIIEITQKGAIYESKGRMELYDVPKNSQIRCLNVDIGWEKDIILNSNPPYTFLLKSGIDLKTIIEMASNGDTIIIPSTLKECNLHEFTIKDKEITIRGEETVSLLGSIKIEDSDVTFEDIIFEGVLVEGSKVLFKKCDGRGIYGEASEITINGSKIHGNEGNGIIVTENSILNIKNSKIYENGTKGKNYPQIWIGNSKAEIDNVEVYNSKGSSGIYGKASEIMINNSRIYGNPSNGIYVLRSILVVNSSSIYRNGYEVSQIDIYGASKVKIKDTNIYECIDVGLFQSAYGIYIESSASTVELENVKTWLNAAGIKCNEYGTSVKIKNCNFKDGTCGGCYFKY